MHSYRSLLVNPSSAAYQARRRQDRAGDYCQTNPLIGTIL